MAGIQNILPSLCKSAYTNYKYLKKDFSTLGQQVNHSVKTIYKSMSCQSADNIIGSSGSTQHQEAYNSATKIQSADKDYMARNILAIQNNQITVEPTQNQVTVSVLQQLPDDQITVILSFLGFKASLPLTLASKYFQAYLPIMILKSKTITASSENYPHQLMNNILRVNNDNCKGMTHQPIKKLTPSQLIENISNTVLTASGEQLKLKYFRRTILQQTAKKEATPWINQQLQFVNKGPNQLIRKICKGEIIIPSDMVKTTVFTILIECGANLDAKNNDGDTALHFAALYGYAETVKALIAAKANLEAKDNNDWTALHFAAYFGRTETVKILAQALIEVGAKLEAKDNSYGWTALHIAATKGHSEIVKTLIDLGANLEAKDNSYGWTALHFAAQNGHTETVKALIAAKANLEAKDNKEYTALHFAARNGNTETVEALIERGAKLEAKNNDDCTALHIAARNGHTETVKVLIAAKAKLDAKNNDGWTALHIAAHKRHQDVVNVLKEYGAKDPSGFTIT